MCVCTLGVFVRIREWEWCAVPHRHSFICFQWSIVTRCHYQAHDLTPLNTSSCTTVLNVSWGSQHQDDRLCMIRSTCSLFLCLCLRRCFAFVHYELKIAPSVSICKHRTTVCFTPATQMSQLSNNLALEIWSNMVKPLIYAILQQFCYIKYIKGMSD